MLSELETLREEYEAIQESTIIKDHGEELQKYNPYPFWDKGFILWLLGCAFVALVAILMI